LRHIGIARDTIAMNVDQTTRPLPIGLLAAAGFLSSAGARVIDPLLHVIATDFETTVPIVAIVITAFTLPYGLNQLVLGPVGDRFGKLRVILGALLAYSIATASCALAGDLGTLTVLRAFAGASSAGLIPVSMAYIGDSVPYAQRQVTLSRFLTGVMIAQMLAGPIGGLFGDSIGWRGVFLVLAAGALIVAGLLATRISGLPDQRSDRQMFNPGLYMRLLHGRVPRVVLIAALLDGAIMAGSFPFIAPFLHDGFGLSYQRVGLVLACFGLGALIYTQMARRIVPRLGEARMVLLGGLLMTGGLLMGMLSHAALVFVAVELMLGLGFFMLHAVLQARATEMLPDARATAVSSFAAVLFLGQSVGALTMGVLIGAFDYRIAFLVDAAAILMFTLWLTRLFMSLGRHRPAR
jgi:predicted MFS family arabinose efflux permease